MSIKKNFLYNLLLTGSNLLFPLLTFPYLSRIIGAEGLGAFNFIMSFCQNFTIVAALGLPMYGMREIARMGEDKVKRSGLFFDLLFFHLVFTLLALIIYFITIFTYPDFRNYREMTLLGALFILSSVFTIEWLFGGLSNFKYITIRSLGVRILSVAAIFLLVKGKGDINLYFAITVLTVLITASLNMYYSRKYISGPFNISIKRAFSHFKPVLLLGIYMVLTSIYSVLPMTLLGFLSTKVAVGYYFSANKIIYMTISVFTALTIVVFPKLNMYIENQDRAEYNSIINKALNVIISLGIPGALLIFLLADPIVMLLAGEEFVSSVLLVRIMAPLILIIGFAQVFVIMILNVHRKEKQMVFLALTGMGLSLLINLIFISRFAERASSIAQLTSEITVMVISFFVAKKVVQFTFPLKLFIMNLLFVLPFIPLVYLGTNISDNLIIKLLASGSLCGIYYVFYQFFILKDKFILELSVPYLVRLKTSFVRIWRAVY